jgi:hypothetical protein
MAPPKIHAKTKAAEEQRKRAFKPPFQPGHAPLPGGGRPKGSRNRLSEKFLADLCAAWEQHGTKVITEVVEKRPEVFLKVAASLVPKEWHLKRTGPFDEMDEDELLRALAQVRSVISANLRENAQTDAVAEDGKSKLN